MTDPATDFDDFYAAERVGLLRLAWLLTGSGDDAADVVNEAFATVWERWARVENPAGYVRVCVVHEVRRRQRRRALERRVLGRQRERVSGPPEDPLADALAALPPAQRAVVVLRFYEDRNEAEIAELLGVAPGTVKSRLHRGLSRLREDIDR